VISNPFVPTGRAINRGSSAIPAVNRIEKAITQLIRIEFMCQSRLTTSVFNVLNSLEAIIPLTSMRQPTSKVSIENIEAPINFFEASAFLQF